ncbi:MAG: AAA family ATPase, partial [Candidatus Altiarchaeales archaeon]|nr:AAA family ATPase [Candidatus Altiarchaeales archaeon]
KSPFIKTTSKNTPIVTRKEEYKKLEEAIGGWDRLMLLTAPIGYGKTTFMNQIKMSPPHDIKYVIGFNAYEPPKQIMKDITAKLPFFKKIFKGKPTQSSFGAYLEGVLQEEKLLLIFDEAQDYENDVFRWLRIINDYCDTVFMLFIGLGGLEDKISAHASLRDRKCKMLTLNPLRIEDLEDIVMQRIKWVGGEPPIPFTQEGIKRLCEAAQAIPRTLLDKGQTIIEYCAKKDIQVIGVEQVEEALGANKPRTEKIVVSPEKQRTPAPSDSFYEYLSPTQQEIVSFLLEREKASISEIGQAIGSDIRSTGSLIRKLRGQNPKEVERKPQVPYPVVIKRGKERRLGRLQGVFGLSDNARRLLSKTG